jgi:hypothetical protein
VLDGHRRTWHVYKRGEYVSFRLPFRDAGGERTYICPDGHWKIHVDENWAMRLTVTNEKSDSRRNRL